VKQEKKKTANVPSNARKLDLDGETFYYKVGDQYIQVWDSTKSKSLFHIPEVLGISVATFEEAKQEGGAYPVTPQDMCNFLRSLKDAVEDK